MRKILLRAPGLVLALILLAGCGQTLDPFEYLSVEFSGLSGNGKAKAHIDDAFEHALFAAAGYKDGDDLFAYLDLYAGIDCEVTPSEGLSNGDTVTLTISTNETVLEKHNLSIAPLSKEFPVLGLTEGKVVDLFTDVELVWEGASPFLQVKAVSRSNDSFLKSVRYRIEDSSNRRIGDEVVVTANVSQSEAEEEGYLVEQTEKVFVIDSADKCVERFDELPQEFFAKLLQEVGDLVIANFANRGDAISYSITGDAIYVILPDNHFGAPSLRNVLLLTPKPNTSTWGTPFSSLYVTAVVSATNREGTTYEVPVIVQVPEVILRETGEASARFEKMTLSYTANVLDPEVLVQTVIDKNRADYTSESGILKYDADAA